MIARYTNGAHLKSAAMPTGPIMAEKKADLEYLHGQIKKKCLDLIQQIGARRQEMQSREEGGLGVPALGVEDEGQLKMR